MKNYFQTVSIVFIGMALVFLGFFLFIGPIIVLAYHMELGNVKIAISIVFIYGLIILPLGLPLMAILYHKVENLMDKQKSE